MPSGGNFTAGLLSLRRHESSQERRTIFRQSLAALAVAADGDGASPLDAVDPEALAASVGVALADRLFDDLGWLAAPAAAIAVYEIASALPIGAHRRELGRRTLIDLYEGNAATFVALATRMAVSGAPRGLTGAGVRARVSLVLDLPAGTDVPDGPLALALVTRRELSSDWLGERAAGSLPERRLAARLMERAAQEAARRWAEGDASAVRVFERAFGAAARAEGDLVAATFRRLLADRETLVWRHVANARGALAGALPEAAIEIEAALSSKMTPTEWRRAAASLVASVAATSDRDVSHAIALAEGPLIARDPGIATAMVWGAAALVEAEPEVADTVLSAVAAASPLFASEALVDLRRWAKSAGDRAARHCAEVLAATVADVTGEEDVSAIVRDLVRELTGEPRTGLAPELEAKVSGALQAFVDEGAREAQAHAEAAFERVGAAIEELEAVDIDERGWPASAASRKVCARHVRALDALLLESATLRSLLVLDRKKGEAARAAAAVEDIDERLAGWLTLIESVPNQGTGPPEHATQHQRQLRALLHLIDGQTADLDDDPERRARIHARWTSAIVALLARLSRERPAALRRAIAATIARALDALVRAGAADPADVLLYAASRAGDAADLQVLAEASMQPDTSKLLASYAELARDEKRTGALDWLVASIPAGASQRTEALRTTLARLARALRAIGSADSLRALVADASPLFALEDDIGRLEQLIASAARRCSGRDATPSLPPPAAYPLALAARRAIERGANAAGELVPSIEALVERARARLPKSLAEMIASALPHLLELARGDDGAPASRPAMSEPMSMRSHPFDARLPAWLPARRTLGGFYVHKQLGRGAGGTVFVVTRVEDRNDPHAQRFALKVPDYDATAARSLSEAEFQKLFREEASALLAVPEHENLARFVTFDAGARPKPILVMELVEGARLDQPIASRLLTTEAALDVLDGILAGLVAMHSVGVGHLDLKPSNVILRERRTEEGAAVAPVLVDFGLAGRHIRPGCATGSYGAPEVWMGPDGAATPLTADVYGFGCLAYEILTGRTLFEADTEIALVSAHLIHDGAPRGVKLLATHHRELAELLSSCLRRSPADRRTAAEVRAELSRIAGGLAGAEWPLVPKLVLAEQDA